MRKKIELNRYIYSMYRYIIKQTYYFVNTTAHQVLPGPGPARVRVWKILVQIIIFFEFFLIIDNLKAIKQNK